MKLTCHVCGKDANVLRM